MKHVPLAQTETTRERRKRFRDEMRLLGPSIPTGDMVVPRLGIVDDLGRLHLVVVAK